MPFIMSTLGITQWTSFIDSCITEAAPFTWVLDKQYPTVYKQYHHYYYYHFTALRILFGTTQVSWYQKKHSPTHTYCGHQSSLICFLHLLWHMASSLFNLRAWQSFCQYINCNEALNSQQHICDIKANIILQNENYIQSLGRFDKIRKTRMGFYGFCMVRKALGLMEMGPPWGHTRWVNIMWATKQQWLITVLSSDSPAQRNGIVR